MAKSFALTKKPPSPFGLVAKKITKIRCNLSRKKIFFGDAESWKIIFGKVNTILAEIDGDILPEVGQLETRADLIRKLGKFCAPFAVDEEDESADGVGTATTVVEDGGKVFVTALDDVLFEGAEEIEEKGIGEFEFSLGFLQGCKDPSVGAVVLFALQSVLPRLPIGAENL